VKYLLNLYGTAEVWEPGSADRAAVLRGYSEGAATIRERGALVHHEVVADPSTCSVVRVDDGPGGTVVSVSDGPYLATGHQLASCFIVDCESREQAIELAAQIPAARSGGVEVRPLMGWAGLEL
jgi:hypothetical protein